MECVFRGLKKVGACVPRQKCYGIACLVRELGGTNEFAENFARWVWRRQLLNKLRDSKQDSPKNVSGKIKKGLIRIITPFFEIRGDPYQLELPLHQIELQLNQMEQEYVQSKISQNPMTYFEKVGEAYGTILRGAAIGARASRSIRDRMEMLGKALGTSVSLRDSVIDLKNDKISGNFNPFKSWTHAEIMHFYREQQNKLSQLMIHFGRESTGILTQTNPKKVTIALAAIQSFAIAPIMFPKQRLQALTNTCPNGSSFSTVITGIIIGTIALTAGICCCITLSKKGSSSPGSCSGCDCKGCDCDTPSSGGSSDCSGCDGGGCDCSGCDCSGCDCGGCDLGGCSGC